MKALLTFLDGKKTHLLLAAAIVLNAFGYMQTPDGIDFTRINNDTIVQSLFMAAFMAMRSGIKKVGG